MREPLKSNDNAYLAIVRVALTREPIPFRDTGDLASVPDNLLPTSVFVLDDADYDCACACAVIRDLNEAAFSVTTSLQKPPSRSVRALAAFYIGAPSRSSCSS